MSTSSHARSWQAPAAAALSIRATAALTGAGTDNFSRQDIFHRPGSAPAAPTMADAPLADAPLADAPLADVGARPPPARAASVPAGRDRRGWEVPAVTVVTL